MKKKNIYLIRHGEIYTAKEKTYIGILDIPLNREGILQAKKLKDFFSHINIDKIYSSDLIRSVQTANIIMEDRSMKLIELSELREINMGNWEGKTFKEIKEKYEDLFEFRMENIKDFKPQNGESFGECRKRAMDIFNKIAKSDGYNILIVAHAGVNRVIIASLLGIPIKDLFIFKQDYGCINKITYNNNKYTLEYINYFC